MRQSRRTTENVAGKRNGCLIGTRLELHRYCLLLLFLYQFYFLLAIKVSYAEFTLLRESVSAIIGPLRLLNVLMRCKYGKYPNAIALYTKL